MLCFNCKKEISDNDANFCPKCGIKLIKKEPAQDYILELNKTEKEKNMTINIESNRFDFIEAVDKEIKNENMIPEVKRSFDTFEIEKYKIQFRKIIKESKEINNDTISLLRKKISEYFNKIPNHSIIDLGEKINIKEIIFLPIYYVELTTFYNKRNLEKGIIPHLDNKRYGEKIKTEENVDIWSYKIKNEGDFKYYKKEYVINGSQEVLTCYNCNGSGRVICLICSGSGRVICGSCDGKGTERCWSCGGNGFREESRYNSNLNTYITQRISCHSCGGRGFNICNNCKGSGYVICYSCDGIGFVTCKRCLGHGRVVEFLYISDEYNNKIQNLILLNKLVPENFKDKLVKDENFETIAEFVDNEIPQELVDCIEYDTMHIKILEMLSNIKEFFENDINRKNYKILKNKISIKKINAYKIDYEFENKLYKIFVTEKGDIAFTENPILEIAQKYYEEGSVNKNKKDFDNAYKLIKKACEMFPEKAEWRKELKIIEEKIIQQYFIGSFFSSALCLISLICIFFIFQGSISELDYFKDLYKKFSFDFINNIYIILNLISFFASWFRAGSFLKNKFGIKLANKSKRILIGFLYGFLFFFIFFILFFLLINLFL